MYKKKIK